MSSRVPRKERPFRDNLAEAATVVAKVMANVDKTRRKRQSQANKESLADAAVQLKDLKRRIAEAIGLFPSLSTIQAQDRATAPISPAERASAEGAPDKLAAWLTLFADDKPRNASTIKITAKNTTDALKSWLKVEQATLEHAKPRGLRTEWDNVSDERRLDILHELALDARIQLNRDNIGIFTAPAGNSLMSIADSIRTIKPYSAFEATPRTTKHVSKNLLETLLEINEHAKAMHEFNEEEQTVIDEKVAALGSEVDQLVRDRRKETPPGAESPSQPV